MSMGDAPKDLNHAISRNASAKLGIDALPSRA